VINLVWACSVYESGLFPYTATIIGSMIHSCRKVWVRHQQHVLRFGCLDARHVWTLCGPWSSWRICQIVGLLRYIYPRNCALDDESMTGLCQTSTHWLISYVLGHLTWECYQHLSLQVQCLWLWFWSMTSCLFILTVHCADSPNSCWASGTVSQQSTVTGIQHIRQSQLEIVCMYGPEVCEAWRHQLPSVQKWTAISKSVFEVHQWKHGKESDEQ